MVGVLGELPQVVVALLFPALTTWSVAASCYLAYPGFPHETSGAPFPAWNTPPIFRGRLGEPFLGLLLIAVIPLGLSGLIWMFMTFPWWLVLMFLILGAGLGNKVYQWQQSMFLVPMAIALVLGDVGLLALHWTAWSYLRPA